MFCYLNTEWFPEVKKTYFASLKETEIVFTAAKWEK